MSTDVEATTTDLVVRSEPAAGVAQLTLNRPERLNAMTLELVDRLHEQLDAIATDRSVRVVVLTGTGRGFCAGLDLAGRGSSPFTDGLGRTQTSFASARRISGLVPKLRALPQPVIAAVNGAAAGGGFALVLGSDVRIAARSARFTTAFIRIGLSGCEMGTSWILPRLIGVGHAHELMLTGRMLDADEALRLGLVTAVHDDDALPGAALAVAAEIAAKAPFAVQLTKEAMWAALEIPAMNGAIELEIRQQIVASTTDEHADAVQEFVGKRSSR